MQRNVGGTERILRALGAAALLSCSALGPLSSGLGVAVLAGMGVYLLFTALAGSCLGYRLLGKSSCALGERA